MYNIKDLVGLYLAVSCIRFYSKWNRKYLFFCSSLVDFIGISLLLEFR